MRERIQIRPEATVTPALTAAIHRLDEVQAAVRAEAAMQPVTVTEQIIWQAPTAAELAAWKDLSGVKYLGQPRVAHEVRTETRPNRTFSTQSARRAETTQTNNKGEGHVGQEVAQSRKKAVDVPNVPTQKVGSVAARIGGRPW